MSSTTYYNRQTRKTETEAIYGERYLRWIYETRAGQLTLKLLVRRALFSKIMGWQMNRKSSARKVLPFIVNYTLDADECAKNPLLYKTFNEFFSRSLKPEARPIAEPDNNKLAILPADGRHLVFPDLSATDGFYVKNQRFTLAELLDDEQLAARYADGSMLISRLCPTDYHRFHFPVGGTPSETRHINGYLYSVHPIALTKNIRYLVQNKRAVTRLDTEKFGEILILEVGATSVGTIKNLFAENHPVNKGDLKGLFAFGGSCVITIFQKNRIQFAPDLLEQSAAKIETYAQFGTPLGAAKM